MMGLLYMGIKGMFHGKLMLIDNELTVIGTTNFTSRSFNINDEMNFYIYGILLWTS